ncbi:ACP phosphodiesterase [Rubritalea tangerina]|uniref:ACP phosphodiesterase n=1 Tax=Rubritalea tangerina TaxID=430798 RepID=A0ABW4ZE57_9BACT
MNFLAHLALAPPAPAHLMGNLLGDFAKGTAESLWDRFPSAIVPGLLMHRAIDQFTDQHPLLHRDKQRFSPHLHRYAGIAIDIIYDHFLSRHWNQFYQQPLEHFITNAYSTIEAHPEWWIGDFPAAFQDMKQYDWLRTYATRHGIQVTLERVSQRSRFLTPLADCYADFIQHYHAIEQNFLKLYPQLQDFALSGKPNH